MLAKPPRISIFITVTALITLAIVGSSVGIAQSTVMNSETTTENISISVVDSSNGQDTATAPITVSADSTPSEVPTWVNDAAITEEQYRAFDADGNGGLVGDEVRGGVEEYINSLPTGTVDGTDFTGNDIRALVEGYIDSL